jgi:two-component system LytT family response regulator
VHAIDYVLKPFDDQRLATTMERVKRQLLRPPDKTQEDLRALLTAWSGTRHPRRIAIKADGKTVFVPVDEIDYVEAAGNYVRIQAGADAHLVRERLSQMEATLPPDLFARIHKSTIVNIERVREMHPLFNGDQTLVLRGGKQLTLSRTYRVKFLSLLATDTHR